MDDKIIVCNQCRRKFLITVHEQERWHKRGMKLPKECPECRKQNKKIRSIMGCYPATRGHGGVVHGGR